MRKVNNEGDKVILQHKKIKKQPPVKLIYNLQLFYEKGEVLSMNNKEYIRGRDKIMLL